MKGHKKTITYENNYYKYPPLFRVREYYNNNLTIRILKYKHNDLKSQIKNIFFKVLTPFCFFGIFIYK